MFSALLVCVTCLAIDPPAAAGAGLESKTTDLALYEEAKARMGHGADAHARMALWCESHGLDSERAKHLAIAVLTDPAHATARGLLGLVAFRGQWQSPAAIHDGLSGDKTRSAALAEYNRRRRRMDNSADAHWKIALWCESQQLSEEASAHLTIVTQLDPDRDAAWKRLGYKKVGRRWTTDQRLAALKADAEARRKADKHWMTLLPRLRSSLEDKPKQAAALQALADVTDPLAVHAVWTTFALGKAADQKVAVQILGQIDSPGSTRALALLAVASDSPEVRSIATGTLRYRDPREINSLLVGSMSDAELDSDPILYHYLLQPIGSDAIGSPGFLFVKGTRYNVFRSYTVDESRTAGATGSSAQTIAMPGYFDRVMRQRERQVFDLQMIVNRVLIDAEGDILAVRDHAARVAHINARIVQVLTAVNGQYSRKDQEAWRKWWVEEQGYAYEQPAPPSRQDLTLGDDNPTYSENVHFSCFAAGTPVHTIEGPRPIESVKIGDRVLTQDSRTGALDYKPVVAAPHNKPAALWKIGLGQESIRATGIHRFWKVGHGWVMARDLKPGDALRALGRVATVKMVQRDLALPVFNLKVMNGQSFLVGDQGILVHDNSPVEPVDQPFDAVPNLAAITRRPTIE